MEELSDKNEEVNLGHIDEMKPFYERPEDVDRKLSEVAPRPGETDEAFIERAKPEFAKQYPDSSNEERAKRMAKLTLESERRQMMRQESEKAQREHEQSADSEYRAKLASLQKEYQDRKAKLISLHSDGTLDDKTFQESMLNAKNRWLNDRRAAFRDYNERYHRQVELDAPSAEDIEQFRQQQTEELNQEHERLVNYEARRLGIDKALDDGMVSMLAEGDFDKMASTADLGKVVRRGLGKEKSTEADYFIDMLWQPEVEAIKHNAVMRVIASPIRWREVKGEDGKVYEEEHFILPIDNPEFTEYIAENINGKGDVMMLCTGLSKALEYGSGEEALERAKWFYNLVHEKAGLDSDDIFALVGASKIVRDGNQGGRWSGRYNELLKLFDVGKDESEDSAWNEAYNDFVLGIRFDEKEQGQNDCLEI